MPRIYNASNSLSFNSLQMFERTDIHILIIGSDPIVI
jgi:hypothetical protein